jgi:hypothetical protein
MNEPQVADDGVTMDYLKTFYMNATEVVKQPRKEASKSSKHGMQRSFDSTTLLANHLRRHFWVRSPCLSAGQ